MVKMARKHMLAVALLILGQVMTHAELQLATSADKLASAPRIASGQTATAVWNPSSDTNVVGYLIRYGLSSESCTNLLDAGAASSVTVYGLETGLTYYFSVTAYDNAGQESAPSNEITYTVQESTAPSERIALQMRNDSNSGMTLEFEATSAGTYVIQATEDLKNWEPIQTNNVTVGTITFPVTDAATYPHRFYRMVKN